MRSLMIATLALTPSLLVAQAKVPAMQARLAAPNAIAAADHAVSTPTSLPRISTGVVAPRLVHTVNVEADHDWKWHSASHLQTAVVSMTVGQDGKPQDLKIVRSVGADMDKNVLAAVSQYRFRPGTLSSQPISMPLKLEVDIVNPQIP